MSSFEEVKKALQEIQNLLNETEKLFSFQDVHKEIKQNIDSLKELTYATAAATKMNDEDIDSLSPPQLTTYKPLPKVELNIDQFINDLQQTDGLTANRNRQTFIKQETIIGNDNDASKEMKSPSIDDKHNHKEQDQEIEDRESSECTYRTFIEYASDDEYEGDTSSFNSEFNKE